MQKNRRGGHSPLEEIDRLTPALRWISRERSFNKAGEPMNYIDMLSRLGAGSAHPGGFFATLEQLSKFPLPPSGHILEVGCGTGRTACYIAERGYQVTAIDIHSQMLAKAMNRAKLQGVDVQFIQADVCSLPFPESHFDVIIAESVTNFTPVDRSMREYYRVLKHGGILYDREIIAEKPIPEDVLGQFTSFFGISQLLNQDEWLNIARHCGFDEAAFAEVKPFDNDTLDQQGQHPDPHQMIDEGAFLDNAVWQSVARHAEIITDNIPYLAYGLIRAKK